MIILLFNSYPFILLFLPITLCVYYAVGRSGNTRYSKAVLLLFSYVFLAFANPLSPLILFFSTVCNYFLNEWIRTARSKARHIAALGIVFNVMLLACFKYSKLLIVGISHAFRLYLAPLQILLPVGISFYTFQQIAFLVDNCRGEIPTYGFLDYFLFNAYFPKVIQGPIPYHTELLPQFNDPARLRFDASRFSSGLMLFAMGLAKKVLLADNFGKIVDFGFGHIPTLNSFEAALVVFGYTLQIYFDFSGYCNMALGVSRMLNLDLPLNFNSPYKALNINDFWKRWHITLTRFLTKYIYIPLGGNRKGKLKTYLNILIVFLVSGIWHGTGLPFLVWGALHGIASILYRLTAKLYDRIPKLLQCCVTFLFVTFAWIFFRAGSLSDAIALLGRLFSGGFGVNAELTETMLQPTIINVFTQFLPFSAVMILLFGLVLLGIVLLPNSTERAENFRPSVPAWIFTYVLLTVSILSISGVSTFLYSNF